MQFKVPQDVQRADTIIGPLTWRHLGILAGGGGICYAIYITLAKTYMIEVWLPPIVILGSLTLALAFLKIYNLTFEKFMMCFIEYHFLPKKRIWKKGQAEPFVSFLERQAEEEKDKIKPVKEKEQKSQKSIKEISKILDAYGKEAQVEPVDQVKPVEQEQLEKKKELEKIINHQK